MYGIVYRLTNTINGKQYIGQTTYSLDVRWREHARCARSHQGGCPILSRAIRKHSPDAFATEVLAECGNQDALNIMEEYFIWELETLAPNGYNLKAGGDGGGRHHQESIRRMSAARLGKTLSAEHRAKISAANLGRTHSAEARAKISMAHLGKTLSAEHCAKLSTAHLGKTHSAEACAKMSAAHLGKTHSAEHRAKIGGHNPRARAVIRTNDGAHFGSAREAARAVGVTRGHISECCMGKRKTACGFTWRYADLAHTQP